LIVTTANMDITPIKFRLNTKKPLPVIEGGKNQMPIKDTRFQPGNPGGPGRPVGSKNKLSENFLHALAEDFEKHGIDAIERVCKDSPGEYLRVIAGLIPKEFLLDVTKEETETWVINAQPQLSVEEWVKQHGLDKLKRNAIEGEAEK